MRRRGPTCAGRSQRGDRLGLVGQYQAALVAAGADTEQEAQDEGEAQDVFHARQYNRVVPVHGPAMSPSLFVLIPALSCAIFALIFVAGMRRCLRRRTALGAGVRGVLALGFGLAALGLFALALSIWHYLTLQRETMVADISFQSLGPPQRFQANVTTADGRQRTFDLNGDQWQLDARVVTWKLPALLAGAPALYRVERLSGRYHDITQERDAERSVHALDAGALDLWRLKQQFPRYLPFVDAHYGSAAYLPMFDGARYSVTFDGRGGLVARPADEATRDQVERSAW